MEKGLPQGLYGMSTMKHRKRSIRKHLNTRKVVQDNVEVDVGRRLVRHHVAAALRTFALSNTKVFSLKNATILSGFAGAST
jgi:hypothetical protein